MPTRTRQPNRPRPERQGADAAQQRPAQPTPNGEVRKRKKKRPPLSTVLFPGREEKRRHKRRRHAAPDSRAERQKLRLRRQKRYRLIYKLITLLLIVVSGILALTLFFKAETIRVQGRSRYSDEELIMTSGLEPGDNLFRFSRRGVRKRLLDTYPYLDTVTIERKMPNQIILHVADATPAAAIGSETTYYFMDAGGKLLEQVSLDRLGSVPVVTGVTIGDSEVGKRLNMKHDERLQQLTQLLNSLEKYGLMNRVDFINLSDMANVRVGCDGHMYIRFGTLDRLDYKMSFAQKFIEETSASLYCEIEVSGEILWEGRESYRVIPVDAEEVAAQSRDSDAAVTLPVADPNADPNTDPGAETNADQDGEPGADAETDAEPTPPLPQTVQPSLAGPAQDEEGDEEPSEDEQAKDDDQDDGNEEAAQSGPAPSRYLPGSGGMNWRQGGG